MKFRFLTMVPLFYLVGLTAQAQKLEPGTREVKEIREESYKELAWG